MLLLLLLAGRLPLVSRANTDSVFLGGESLIMESDCGLRNSSCRNEICLFLEAIVE